MLSLLWFAVTNFLVPLIVWSAVFVVVTIVLAIPMARWCVVRMRPVDASGRMSSNRRWLLRTWIVVVLFILPPGIALFNAVPFAASRALALMIEDSEPGTTKWVADFVAQHGDTLGLDPELVKSWTATGSSYLVRDFASGLHLAAWGHVATAVALVAACHAGTILLFKYSLREREVGIAERGVDFTSDFGRQDPEKRSPND